MTKVRSKGKPGGAAPKSSVSGSRRQTGAPVCALTVLETSDQFPASSRVRSAKKRGRPGGTPRTRADCGSPPVTGAGAGPTTVPDTQSGSLKGVFSQRISYSAASPRRRRPRGRSRPG